MRKQWIYAIQIVVSLTMVCGLATGCAVPSATSPPSSEYPADISGHVIIAEKVKCLTAIAVPPSRDSDVFWIVDIAVKNNAYSDPVVASLETGYGGWRITANDKVYQPRASDEELSIALRQTGQFVLYFEVPRSLQINDAQICYQGQEPYSYGELTGGDRVVAYDWGSKTVIEATQEVDQYEQYYIFGGPFSNDRYISLRTVGSWEGEGDKLIEFSLDKSPAVLNFAYTPTSAISYGFDYGLQGRGYSELGSKFWSKLMGPTKKSGNTYHMSEVVEGTGEFRLKITSHGAHWYVRLGVE